jgi:hypothetical protein
MKKILSVLLLIVMLATNLMAVLPYYTGARSLGMGGAYTSIANDPSSLYWNPAGLGLLSSKEISGVYFKDFFDASYSFAGYSQPVKDYAGIALGWAHTGIDFEKTDQWGNSTGSGKASNDVFMMGFGYYNTFPVSLGATFKNIREKIDTFSLAGWGIDAGAMYEAKPLRVGFMLRNFLLGDISGMSKNNGRNITEKLPASLTIGMSYQKNKTFTFDDIKFPDPFSLSFVFATDIVFPFDRTEKAMLNIGSEMWINEVLGIRAGIIEGRDYTTGISLKYHLMQLDYTLISSRTLENTNILATSIYF